MEKKGVDNVNVAEVLLQMRKCRMGLIQTADQLRFSYIALLQGLKVDWSAQDEVQTSQCLPMFSVIAFAITR